jgi:hypothetical protein
MNTTNYQKLRTYEKPICLAMSITDLSNKELKILMKLENAINDLLLLNPQIIADPSEPIYNFIINKKISKKVKFVLENNHIQYDIEAKKCCCSYKTTLYLGYYCNKLRLIDSKKASFYDSEIRPYNNSNPIRISGERKTMSVSDYFK